MPPRNARSIQLSCTDVWPSDSDIQVVEGANLRSQSDGLVYIGKQEIDSSRCETECSIFNIQQHAIDNKLCILRGLLSTKLLKFFSFIDRFVLDTLQFRKVLVCLLAVLRERFFPFANLQIIDK